jgi:hypothetical protein
MNEIVLNTLIGVRKHPDSELIFVKKTLIIPGVSKFISGIKLII